MTEMTAEHAELRATRVTFGKHKGHLLEDVPERYLRWMLNPVITDRKSGKAKTINVPEDMKAAAARLLEFEDALKVHSECAAAALGGQEHDGGDRYVIEYLGGLERRWKPSIHNSLDEALGSLCALYPVFTYEEDGIGDPEDRRQTPDPEDDRILIWEVLPSGHRKVVWHFSGWHFDQNEFGPQGTLPGDDKDFYTLAMTDY